MQKSVWAAVALLAAACASAQTQPTSIAEAKPEVDSKTVQVMILGSWHMAGSSSNVIDVETESVLTARRQSELEDLANTLTEFEPTVVATEVEAEAPDYIDPNFAEFNEEMLSENANEIVQVAFRLAEKAGVTRVHGIDESPSEGEPDYFPLAKLAAHAKATGQEDRLNAMIAKTQSDLEAFERETANDHLALKLWKVNTDDRYSADAYYNLQKFDRGEDQPGAELQAYWFMRNAKIWSKLMNVTKPGDRVVVVYGVGHKHWLEHLAEHTPGYVRIDPAPYLLKAAGEN